MENIRKEFNHDKILLVYRCGSYAFGTSTDNSDEDYIVVLKDYKGLTHRGYGKKEYFIFGLDDWKDKMEFSEQLAPYFEAHNDEILALPDSAVFIDDEIKPLVEKYRQEFPQRLTEWLKTVVEYFSFYLGLGEIEKRFYHIVRIKDIVDNYKTTNTLSLTISDQTKQWIAEFKAATNKEQYRQEILSAFEYLRKLTEVET